MTTFTTEVASLTFRWTFSGVLPAIPLPATKYFGDLCERLRDFGVTAQDISVDSPSNNLGDVAMRVFVLGGRAVLKITYSSFEVTANPAARGDEEPLSKLAETVFDTLMEISTVAAGTSAYLSWTGHLKLFSNTVEDILARYVNSGATQLRTEGAIFKLESAKEPRADLTLLLARSLMVENGLMVLTYCDYQSPGSPKVAGERFSSDCEDALALVGLSFDRSSGEAENNDSKHDL